jgi:hypothetical protein
LLLFRDEAEFADGDAAGDAADDCVFSLLQATERDAVNTNKEARKARRCV